MGELQGALINVACGLAGALLTWIAKDLRDAKRAKTKADISRGMVPEKQCEVCHAEWDAKLAAGDERMDVGAEVDAFVVRWLPVICESVGLDSEVCKTMRAEATALLNKVLNAGRAPRGKPKEAGHA